MRSWIVLTVSSLLLFGCTQTKYINPDNPQADFGAAKIDCDNQVLMSSSGVALTRSAMGKPGPGQGIRTQSANQRARIDVEQCLESKGWTRETESK